MIARGGLTQLLELLAQTALLVTGPAGARAWPRPGAWRLHRTTLLRLAALPDPVTGCAPHVLGDDFALRRGHVYGAVMVDVTSGEAIGLPPGRVDDRGSISIADAPSISVVVSYAGAAVSSAGRQ